MSTRSELAFKLLGDNVTQNIHYRYASIDGHKIFYREAGPANAPVLLLLHGYPTSSYMFRDLVPKLANRYHIIAPDHLGFGLSDAPNRRRVRLHVRRSDRSDGGAVGPTRPRPLRPLRPGLRCAHRLAPRATLPLRDYRDYHPEWQRLRGRSDQTILGTNHGLPAGPESRDRKGRQMEPDPGSRPLAIQLRGD